jgi:hypothetical protein
MIKLINESLFKKTTDARQNDRGEYFLTSFASAVKTPDPKKKDVEFARTIATIIHSEADNFNQENTRISIGQSKSGFPTMHIGQGANNKYDTDVYLIAVPYSGVMAPIEKSYEYRIYKGLTVRAEKRTIEFEGQKYNKIAFLAVVLNESMFNEDNEHHKDQLVLTINSYNLENSGDDKETIKTTTSITFERGKEPVVNTSSEKVEPIDMNEFKGKRVFPIYQGPKKNDKNENSEGTDSGEKKTYHKDHDAENIGSPVVSKSLDEMLADAEKDRSSKFSRKDDYNRRSGKKGKNKKKRR